jgi:hypothetical protein
MGSQLTRQVVTVPGLQWTVSEDDSDTGSGPLFWIYVDSEGHWCLRREGGATQAFFGSRADAAAFLQDVEGDSPYRLFIETQYGKVVLEQHGVLSSSRRGHTENGAANAASVGVEDPAAKDRATDLGRRLPWANQLASAARVSWSRISSLADWLHSRRS